MLALRCNADGKRIENGAFQERWRCDFLARVFLNHKCRFYQYGVDETIVTLVDCASLTRRRYHFFPQVWWRRTFYNIREDNRRLVLHLRGGHHVTANSYHAGQESYRAKIAIPFLLYLTWYKHQSKIRVLGAWALENRHACCYRSAWIEASFLTGYRVVFSRPSALQSYTHADVHTFWLADLKRSRIALVYNCNLQNGRTA